MPDFSWIEAHPWATTAVVGLGGLGLYLLLRGGSSGSSGADAGGGVVYAGGGGPSDTQVAANAALTNAQLQANTQVSQMSAELAALNIQSDLQLKLAHIGADVTNTGTAAALTSDLYRTGAELTYGLSSQQAALEMARINAGVQQSYIDKLTGGTGAITQTPIRAAVPMPEPLWYEPGTPTQIQIQTPAGVGPVIPGGSPLVAWPNYADCDPFDSACVARNSALNTGYNMDVATAQAANNRNQLAENYRISIDAGTITAAQLAEYRKLVGAS